MLLDISATCLKTFCEVKTLSSKQNTYRCLHTNTTGTAVLEKQTSDQDTIPTKPTKVEDICDHLKSETRKKPDVVIMHAGTNDLTNDSKSLKNYKRMADSVRSKLPNFKSRFNWYQKPRW